MNGAASRSRSRSGGRRKDGSPPGAQKTVSGGGGGGDEGILKALESHKRALKEAGARAKAVEDDANGWGDVSGIKHAAELIEVQLTDQLLILHAMLDDSATPHGRGEVQGAITDLKSIGERLQVAKRHAACQ